MKRSLNSAQGFLRGTQAYFRDALLMCGFTLFICLPLLSSTTHFVLHRGAIDYLSYDSIPSIFSQHPGVLFSLIVVLMTILLLVYFEFTFPLASVFFIKKKEPISLKQLLHLTMLRLKKVRPITFLFFLAYFLLILPISGLSFNSDLLSKIKIPAFIMSFISANHWIIVSSFLLVCIFLGYIGARLTFALPETTLRDHPFRAAVRESWSLTKSRLLAITGQFIVIGGTILLLSSLGYIVVILVQSTAERFFPDHALISTVFAMTLLRGILLFNIVMSTVGIFYIIVGFMNNEGFLPEIPKWSIPQAPNLRFSALRSTGLTLFAVFFGVGVCLYNMGYLTSAVQTESVTVSRRGMNTQNEAQNTLGALEKASRDCHPGYVEMDVQETKDGHFVMIHDTNLRHLTGVNGTPQDLTLKELANLTVTEDGVQAPVYSFDSCLEKTHKLNRRLLIEIETFKKDLDNLVGRFVHKYRKIILENHHILRSLTYQVTSDLEGAEPNLYVGYILPFNIAGPPVTPADFLTMEYSTINRNFTNFAHQGGKEVYVRTINDSDAMSRMMFYGVDGIITDEMGLLNKSMKQTDEEITYLDKLPNFILGVS